jgi:molybdenum cofactor guanylyltransferase
MEKNKITALILAGGNSKRMGKDKALLTINGQYFLEKTCQIALECTDLVYVITHQPQLYQNILPKNCPIIEEKSLFGESLPHGALLGFIQGFRQVTTPWVLLLPCDLPCLSVSEVRKWIKYLETLSSEVLAVLPKNQKGWDALAGFYHHSSLPLLEEYINQGDRSFQKWLNNNLIVELPVTNADFLLNCNTPEDYKLVKKKCEAKHQ